MDLSGNEKSIEKNIEKSLEKNIEWSWKSSDMKSGVEKWWYEK